MSSSVVGSVSTVASSKEGSLFSDGRLCGSGFDCKLKFRLERLGEEKHLSFWDFKGNLSCEALDPIKSTSAQWLHVKKGASPISISTLSEFVIGSLCEEVLGSVTMVLGESDWELSHDALCLVCRISRFGDVEQS